MRMLFYVLHWESAAALSSCVLQTPQFLCLQGPAWIAHVTLRSWVRVDKHPVPLQPATVEVDKIIPPNFEAAQTVDGKADHIPDIGTYQLTVLSMIMSTNAFGDFSKSTIISQTIEDGAVVKLVEDSNRLWQEFTHQPQTGRCLIFLQMLSMMCLRLCEDYKIAVTDLRPRSDFEVRTMFLSSLLMCIRANQYK
jgi:hypothetical protein